MREIVLDSKSKFCAYHAKNPSEAECYRCSRPLCGACDHRIKGFPYCQDCIVEGVEALQSNSVTEAGKVVRRQSSPLIATLLSLILPGLGAAYNGQTSKAIVHFAIFASFFQMAILSDGAPLFVLGFVGTWFFAAVEACRTAQLIRAGLAPHAEEDAIASRLYGNPLAWGITLATLGVIFLLHNLLGQRLPVRGFLPIALIALGAYVLFDFVRRRIKQRQQKESAFDVHRPPPSVISLPTNSGRFRAGELVTQAQGRDSIEPLPFEQRP